MACKSGRSEDNQENGKEQIICAMNNQSNGKSRVKSRHLDVRGDGIAPAIQGIPY
jgi:hypothetical protein